MSVKIQTAVLFISILIAIQTCAGAFASIFGRPLFERFGRLSPAQQQQNQSQNQHQHLQQLQNADIKNQQDQQLLASTGSYERQEMQPQFAGGYLNQQAQHFIRPVESLTPVNSNAESASVLEQEMAPVPVPAAPATPAQVPIELHAMQLQMPQQLFAANGQVVAPSESASNYRAASTRDERKHGGVPDVVDKIERHVSQEVEQSLQQDSQSRSGNDEDDESSDRYQSGAQENESGSGSNSDQVTGNQHQQAAGSDKATAASEDHDAHHHHHEHHEQQHHDHYHHKPEAFEVHHKKGGKSYQYFHQGH